jgi:phosphomevalonate kinase
MKAGVNFSAVSAPGKVLVAGGYLILDPDQIGLALALSARIHVIVESDGKSHGAITVRSPQFSEAEWKYQVGELSNNFLEVIDAYSLRQSL